MAVFTLKLEANAHQSQLSSHPSKISWQVIGGTSGSRQRHAWLYAYLLLNTVPSSHLQGKKWITDCSYPPDRACGTKQAAINLKALHCSRTVVNKRMLLKQYTARKLKMRTRNSCKKLPESHINSKQRMHLHQWSGKSGGHSYGQA